MADNPDWPLGNPRQLRPHQHAQVWVADVVDGTAQLVHTSDSMLLEAPNWAPDGHGLLLNGDGLLWRLDLDPVALKRVTIPGMPPINNDHVVDAVSGVIHLSANDGHIYVAPIGGGAPERVTNDPSRYHFLHGISPDGTTLAFVDIPVGDFSVAGRLALISSKGGITAQPEAGVTHLDGPEFSPDGKWLYFNTEEFGRRPGHAQLARMNPAGGAMQRLVSSDTVDWFPHVSPDALICVTRRTLSRAFARERSINF